MPFKIALLGIGIGIEGLVDGRSNRFRVGQFDGEHQSLAFGRDRAPAVGDHGRPFRKMGHQVGPQVDLRAVFVFGQTDNDLFHQIVVFAAAEQFVDQGLGILKGVDHLPVEREIGAQDHGDTKS